MKKFVFLALALMSVAARAQSGGGPYVIDEVWTDHCLDSVSDSERASAEFYIKYLTLFRTESLTNATIRNWLMGRSLVSMHRTVKSSGVEQCHYNFAKTGQETESMTNDNLFQSMRIERELRGIYGRMNLPATDLIKWEKTKCSTTSVFAKEIAIKNFKLVSMIKSHEADQCLYIYARNLSEELRSTL